MSTAEKSDYRSLLKEALVELRDMQAQLDQVERLRREPIAIVGMGCRFPGGATDPDAFWELLRCGVDAISEVPSDRWDVDAWYDPDPTAPGRTYTRWGGFLKDVDQFDPAFFGIAPREAGSMDPQHRLLLEVSWEALENAGVPPDSLSGSKTGVFLGVCTNDYSLEFRVGDAIDPYMATGNTFSVAAGRLSYVLGLQGPNVALDTACSSSLVAVHLACQSLRNQDCRMALAAGVNMILSPISTMALSAIRALSPEGRCKTFDASADGFVRGEGCGVVVLKMLSDAVADGDRILALIRGTDINHDGRSSGLTAPNGLSQEAVIRKALANAGVEPAQIAYVEAHGTGTWLGDPIEMNALANVLGAGRKRPFVVGSVKTNVGHLEGAAGVAGLIKVILALRHCQIPPHLHFRNPNPYIDWASTPVVVPSQIMEFEPIDGRRIAGISSFGFSGTNAHLILEEPPAEPDLPLGTERPVHVLTLSARTDQALRDLTKLWEEYLSVTLDRFEDICFTAGAGRSHFAHRLAIAAAGKAQAISLLQNAVPRHCEQGGRRKVAFLFYGESGQYPSMGRELYESSPVFRAALERCDKVVKFLDVLYDGDADRIHGPEYTTACLFAIGYGLAELWRSWGVEPSFVMGHGCGEYAAAVTAGVMNLEDGLRLIARRSATLHDPTLNASRDVKFAAPRVSLISSLTGDVAGEKELAGPKYWADRQPVTAQFEKGMHTLQARGCEIFIEIGPQPMVLPKEKSCLGDRGTWLLSLSKDGQDWVQICQSLANLHMAGGPIDWKSFDKGYARRKVSLPTYPFQRERYWVTHSEKPQPPGIPAVEGLYEVQWRTAPHEPAAESAAAGHCLMVSGDAASPAAESVRQAGWLCTEIPAVRACEEALRILQGWGTTAGRLWFITRGSQPVNGLVSGPDGAALWGLGRVIALEHPELWGGMIDLDPSAPAGESAALLRTLACQNGEMQVAFRDNQRFVPRLVRLPETKGPAPAVRADATYLITGGTGGLGVHVGRWLIENGARHLVLISRGRASAESVSGLRDSGARVELRSADVSCLADVERVVQEIRSTMPPLRGIFHLAGELHDGLLLGQDSARLAAVMAPKIAGTWNLHDATRACELDFFVLFSSATSLLGTPGQGSYAAGNAFLDSFAHFRQSQGLTALTINWGPWQGAGMAASQGKKSEARWNAIGMDMLAPKAALRGMERLTSGNLSQAAVLCVDWDKFVRQIPSRSAQAFLSELARVEEPVETLSEVRPEGLTAYLKSSVQRILATHDEIAEDRNLIELGLDSLMIMDLINDLKRRFPLNLYPRELYAFPTIGALSDYLAGEIRGTPKARSSEITPAFESAQVSARPVQPRRDRIPGVVFILSSPRAGSTLLRVMMAGHPGMFCPPELHLLPFETMGERRERLGLSFLGEGLQRALMELQGCDADASKAVVEQWVEADYSVHEVYRRLREFASPRLLVDKSPIYAGSLATLDSAEALFENARYIHLVRHPYSVIESFVRNRMGKIIGASDEDPYALAEEVWSASNRNVLEFLKKIEPERWHRILYEDLVQSPERSMRACCVFLGETFDPGMLNPYEGAKMTDGVRSKSLSIGDPNFLKHKGIDPSLNDVWKNIQLPQKLNPSTQRLAAGFGYELPREGGVERAEEIIEVRGLPLCVCSWGPVDGPIVFCLHGILEHGAAWEPVALDLARRGFRVIAPDQRGHGRSGHASANGGYYLMDFVADADALTNTFGGRQVTVVGHSMGAAISSLLASVRPRRIASLVLVECLLPGEESAADARDEVSSHLNYLSAGSVQPALPNLAAAASRLRAGTPSMPEAFATQMAERLTEPSGSGVAWRWDPRMRSRAGIAFDGMGTMNRSRYLALLRAIRAPITFVYGRQSPYTNEQQAELLGRLLPDSRAVTIPGGHNLHMDSPVDLAVAIASHAYTGIMEVDPVLPDSVFAEREG